MNFYTSDTHFFHRNVIDYCKRPFSSVEEMNQEMIRRWNSTVNPSDTVFHLGDFSFGKRTLTREVLDQLHGDIILIVGNHDSSRIRPLFKKTFLQWNTKMANQDVTLSHYPFEDLRFPERSPKNERQWLLHGHVHSGWKQKDKMINVGVDVWDFYPVSETQIISLIQDEAPQD